MKPRFSQSRTIEAAPDGLSGPRGYNARMSHPREIRRKLLMLALVIGTAALGSCAKTEECGTCSSDAECRAGFICATFTDGSKRCATGIGESTCARR